VGSVYALFHTTYGRTLLVKIALVVLLIGLGAVSRRMVHRRSGTPSAPTVVPAGAMAAGLPSGGSTAVLETVDAPAVPSPVPRRRLRRMVVAELAVAFAVLGVTAALVNDVPAKQAADLPFSYSFSTLGVQVNTIIDPARTGSANQVHVYVLSSLGTPRAIPELDITTSLPSQSIGPITVPLVISGPGHYYAGHVDFPVAGTWVLTYTVRTDAIDETVTRTVLPVH